MTQIDAQHTSDVAYSKNNNVAQIYYPALFYKHAVWLTEDGRE